MTARFKHLRAPVTLEIMTRIYDMREAGTGYADIARTVGYPSPTVYAWLHAPAFYDPYIDQVAIERAVQGDVDVLCAMSYWEQQVFLAKIDSLRPLWDELQNAQRVGTQSGHGDLYGPHEGVIRFGDTTWRAIKTQIARVRIARAAKH